MDVIPSSYTIRSLDASTWDLFAELVERNNGVYGGCWCIAHHLERKTKLDNRATKHDLVRTGDAHAALVIDEDGLAQGWAQYGSPAEVELLEDLGFERGRQVGKHAWIVSRTVLA